MTNLLCLVMKMIRLGRWNVPLKKYQNIPDILVNNIRYKQIKLNESIGYIPENDFLHSLFLSSTRTNFEIRKIHTNVYRILF